MPFDDPGEATMQKLFAPAALALVLAAAPALASDDDAPGTPREGWLTIQQITEKFTAEGYNVRQVKVEGNGYEVYAVAKDGRRLEADVDPATGAILKSEADD
jgi:hypothetical protein